MSAILLLLVIMGRMQWFAIWRSLSAFALFFALLAILYVLSGQISRGAVYIMRFMLLLIAASLLMYTTTHRELITGFEKLFSPLRFFSVNPRNISLMITATIRFIPLFVEESALVRDAHESRGAHLSKIRDVASFISALLMKVMEKAAVLSDAIISRCYNPTSHTVFKDRQMGASDWLAMILICSATLLFIIF